MSLSINLSPFTKLSQLPTEIGISKNEASKSTILSANNFLQKGV